MRKLIAILTLTALVFIVTPQADAQRAALSENCAPYVSMPLGGLPWHWTLATQHAGRYDGRTAVRGGEAERVCERA
jgi:hypothetical protein